ncbi:MAG: DEAD/DEAH box helicase, partial [Planctomycetes bacterium]|nr:DEAD/DEAH box helicase [Planctomycetota bacterium]
GYLGEVRHDYGSVTVGNDGELVLPASQPGGPLRRRQPQAELQAIAQVQHACEHLQDTSMVGHMLVPPTRLAAVVQQLGAAGIRVQVDQHTLRTSRGTSLRIRTEIDWFELDGAVQFAGGAEVPLGAALAAIERGDHTLQLADGSHAMLPVAELQALRQVSQLGERRGSGLRLRHSQTLLLDALLAGRDRVTATIDDGFRRLRDRLLPDGGVQPRGAPATFQGTLRPYQELGLGWLHFLRDLGLGGCLADDMGLGKTVQVLALLLDVHAAPGPRPSLLVVPLSLLDNWRREAERFAPSLRLLDFHGDDRWQRLGADGFAPFDVVVTTYGTLRSDAAQFEARAQHFEYAILDEAQAIENPASVTSKAVRLLRAEHRLALTGTPVMNHLGELWALFEFLSPGLLGKSATFRQLLAAKTERGEGLDLQLLHRALAPFLLRRTKAAVLPDLPPKQEQAIWCELEGSQLQTYTRLRTRYQKALLSGDRQLGPQERFQVLEALLRLRQAACHEGLLHEDRRGASAKFDALLPMLHELAQSGHKALVFSQFTELLGLLRQQLEQQGLQHEYLDGQTRERQARVDRFQQDGTCPLFLISLKAGGFGLNLTAADYVFLLDPWWNPAAEAQASDRAHRLGQTRPVTVYRLVCKGTVEEKVLELQAQKKELAAAVLGADQSLLAKLTRDDLAALLS